MIRKKEAPISLEERKAAAQMLDEGLVRARTRLKTARKFSKETVSFLFPLKRHKRRLHALEYLRELDHRQPDAPGFSGGDEHHEEPLQAITHTVKRYFVKAETEPFTPTQETRLLKLREKFDKKAQKELASEEYGPTKRWRLALHVATGYGLSHEERLQALEKAYTSEKSKPINMRRRLGIAFGVGVGLGILGVGIRGAAAVRDNIVPFMDSLSQMSTGAMIGTGAAIYTATYAYESWVHARLTREFGTSGNFLVTAIDAAGKRLLSLHARRMTAVAAATSIDFLINTLLVTGVIGGFTGDPKKVMAAFALAGVYNLGLAAAGEVLLGINGLAKLIKRNKQTPSGNIDK